MNSCVADDGIQCKLASADISTYSSLTIHGLGSSDESLADITLTRADSFPPRRMIKKYVAIPRMNGWAPLPHPKTDHCLELELTESIAEGRIGLAYSARVVGNTANLDLPDLCIKLVRPPYGRTLAREAWFYEQLARETGYEGVVTPRCFGFFTVPLKDCLDANGQPVTHIIPWQKAEEKEDKSYRNNRGEEEKEDRSWRLEDDCPGLPFFKDDHGWRKRSPWNKWRPSSSDPLVCILVLEKLGGFYQAPTALQVKSGERNEEEELEDIREIVRELGAAGILHRDLRYSNVVRATHDVICPRHGRAHQWRMIDFDVAAKLHISPETGVDSRYAQKSYASAIGGPVFWGWV